MQETRVQSLGQGDPLDEEMATHSSILAWEISWTEKSSGYSPKGLKESDTEWLSMHLQRPEQIAFPLNNIMNVCFAH